jgi:DNA-binding LytR/AlgR family response regulator
MSLSNVWYDVLESLMQKPMRVFEIKIGLEKFRFYPNDIIRIEADGCYCKIYTTNKKHTISRNLKSAEKIIHGWGFIRINRTHLINVQHIISIDQKNAVIVMSDNEVIKIPRRQKLQMISRLEQKVG